MKKQDLKTIIEIIEYIRDYCCLVDGTGNNNNIYKWINEIIEKLKAGL